MPLSPRRIRARAIVFSSTVRVLAHHDFQKLLDLALLCGLRVYPVADHLLFGAHVMHEALDSLGKIGHGGRGRLASLDMVDRVSQAVDGGADLTRDAGSDSRLGRMIVDSRG